MFQTGNDRECNRNILDLMASLLKGGWDPSAAIPRIYTLLNSDRMDEIEIALDFLRALSD